MLNSLDNLKNTKKSHYSIFRVCSRKGTFCFTFTVFTKSARSPWNINQPNQFMRQREQFILNLWIFDLTVRESNSGRMLGWGPARALGFICKTFLTRSVNWYQVQADVTTLNSLFLKFLQIVQLLGWYKAFRADQLSTIYGSSPYTCVFTCELLECEYISHFLDSGALLQTVYMFYTYLPTLVSRGVNNNIWDKNIFERSNRQYCLFGVKK